MIEVKNIVKKFGSKTALDGISFSLNKGSVWGITGSNGAGKSTLLRILTGVYMPDEGSVSIDGEAAFDKADVKKKCFFVPDTPFFYNNSTLNSMQSLYSPLYPNWNQERFEQLCQTFGLDKRMKLVKMSKGMQRQSELILALSSMADYLFLDEIFDGLDPVKRQTVKKLIVGDIVDREITCLIASHNLRELDDICDSLLMIHDGKLINSNVVDQMKSDIHKIQIAFGTVPEELNQIFSELNVSSLQQNGNYFKMLIKGDIEVIEKKLKSLNPVFYEALPLSLEEIFINEMEDAGYES